MNPKLPKGVDGNAPDDQCVTPAQQTHYPAAQEVFSFSEPPQVRYEGYVLFQADPIPGEKTSWTKAERTLVLMTQEGFCKKVQSRANKISATQQYQSLSEIRQAHRDEVEWSCVYAKERKKPSKARNAHCEDYEIVSMQVILMQRPVIMQMHSRTPMGNLVDLSVHSGTRPARAKWTSTEVDHDQLWIATDEEETMHEGSVHLFRCHYLQTHHLLFLENIIYRNISEIIVLLVGSETLGLTLHKFSASVVRHH
ncbi:hypothetical protein N7451_012491 [Penicillium sp. IBT 35674x]|nr:hypothetical protein N7451_012491 [Penicillium sp. IBT 35674x]